MNITNNTTIKKKNKIVKIIYEDVQWKKYKPFAIYDGNTSIVHCIINKNFSIAQKIKTKSSIQNDTRLENSAQLYLDFMYVYGILQLPTHIAMGAIHESLILHNITRLS